MASPTELTLDDLKSKYASRPASTRFTRLYDDPEFGHMFAFIHEDLNLHFTAINGRIRTTHHYWAENSRALIELLDEIKQDLHDLRRVGIDVQFDSRYEDTIELCREWLSPSGGSTIPEDVELIELVKVEPVFSRPATAVKLKKSGETAKLKMVGEGSYATVHSYVDPDYGIKFAVKRAKRGLEDRDLQRFKQEFEVLKRLSFPYIVEAYNYDDEQNEYRMEFCDETLRAYISKRNTKLPFATRKRIALQFLYGINYIHTQGLLHRDVSLQNILLKVYASGAVLVKLSDFGLVKDQSSTFTRTQTEMRGTIRDPMLHSFKDYGVVNEMYSIGWVLAYIFTGRESLISDGTPLSRIVLKCTASDTSERYQDVLSLIADIDELDATPTDAPA